MMIGCNNEVGVLEGEPAIQGEHRTPNNQPEDASDEVNEITLAYTEGELNLVTVHTVKYVLEAEGVKVDIVETDLSTLWAGIADGTFDGTVSAWLPTTHKHFYEKYKNSVDDLGANLSALMSGLGVPTYVTIDSIDELPVYREKFDGKIFGIEHDSGIVQLTEEAIERYQLPYEIVTGTVDELHQALTDAYEAEDWIVVTGWKPDGRFANGSLKYLRDPKRIYGEGEQIHTVVRQGLEEELPTVYRFLDRFRWDITDVEAIMVQLKDGASPDKAVATWVEQNPQTVIRWLEH